MEARSKVAASIAAIVPFHCVICIEEFNECDRPPVVLPCGHTYVCMPCSKRLRRCMECREPLFMSSPSKAGALHPRPAPVPSSIYRGRYSPTPPMSPPQVNNANSSSIALPIPKNLVLLAMMEVASRQIDIAGKQDADSSNDAVDEEVNMLSGDDEEAFDLNHIIRGMATLAGSCGTFVVKDPDGLVVSSEYPNKATETEEDDDDDDYDRDEKKSDDLGPGTEHPLDEGGAKQAFILHKGQTVQVVGFEDGVAKLARGAGYIAASSSQLVKVQGPLEKSCRLEGLLDTVTRRGKDLQRELEENQRIEECLRKQIEETFKEEPAHPVISPPPRYDDVFASSESREGDAPTQPSTPTSDITKRSDQPFLRSPEECETRDFIFTRGSDVENDENGNMSHNLRRGPYPRSPSSIDNSDLNQRGLPPYRRDIDDDVLNVEFGCVAEILSDSVRLFGGKSESQEVLPGLALAGASESRARSMVSSLMATSPSFDGIDFRTGLSGHRGLNNAKRGMHPLRRGEVRRMSEHRGIGNIWSPTRRKSPSNSPAFGPRFSPHLHTHGGYLTG